MTTPEAATATGILMRVGDTRPTLDVTLVDGQGNPVNLAGAAVEVVLRTLTGTQVWTGAAVVDPDQVKSPGHITYPWRRTDTATPGDYLVDLVVTYQDGNTQTYPAEGGIPITFASGLPAAAEEVLVVPVDEVARRLGLPLPLDDVTEADLTERILDAQTDVETYLHRPVVPTQFTESLAPYYPPGGYSGDLTSTGPSSAQGWPVSVEPVISIDAVVDDPANPGWSLVTYTAGLDARTDPVLRPIRRFVKAAAVEAYRTDNPQRRRLRSMSVEGQSVSFDTTAAGSAGAAPTLASLSRWRVRGVFSRPRLSQYNAPYAGMSGVYAVGPYGLVGGFSGGGDTRGYSYS